MVKLLASMAILSCRSYVSNISKGLENNKIAKIVLRNYYDNEFKLLKINFKSLIKKDQEELLMKASKDNRKEYIEYMLGLDINPFIVDENGDGLQIIIKDNDLKIKIESKQKNIMIINAVRKGNIERLSALLSENESDIYKLKDHEGNDLINNILKILNEEKNKDFIKLFFERYLSKCLDSYEEGKKLLEKIILQNNIELIKILIDLDNVYLNYIDGSLLEEVNKKNMYDMFKYLINSDIPLEEEQMIKILKEGSVQIAEILIHRLEGRDVLKYALENDIRSLIKLLSKKDINFKKILMEELEKKEPDLKSLLKMLEQADLSKEEIRQIRKEAVLKDKSEEIIKVLSSRI